MASTTAILPPSLFVHGRKFLLRTLRKLPVSAAKDGQRRVAVVVKATGESSESSGSLSIVKSVQNVNKFILLWTSGPFIHKAHTDFALIPSTCLKQWDKSEDRIALVGLGFAAIVALWASANLITAIDKLPLIPSALEFIGILFSWWFIYRYLLFKPDR
ncbi:hypothetical protein HHK36_006190 [Tetracentron sinense]|uniref:Cyanobacterial aminoacyl-tRNA synthetase CAAD domain-containing protein n=1 Tax=Tetracentron sinense TaxID=13715 RepID=A0A834ZKE5_TETSI|nr:hypothetical protein HHK36_006190 [Tetracentron sinense]